MSLTWDKILYILFLLIVVFLNSTAQLIISVKDLKTGEEIPNVSIIIKYNQKIQAQYDYAYTNQDGNCIFNVPKKIAGDSILITVSHLNYQSESTVIHKARKKLIIYLNRKHTTLDEIVVESTYNRLDTVSIKFDTTVVKLSNKVIDFLNNDPRFSINGNRLTYKGKVISTVLIDDKNLTGDNYMNFLEIADIRTFQNADVIKNYHESKIDIGFKKPSIALRLNTKEEHSKRFVGELIGSVSQKRINEVGLSAYNSGENVLVFADINSNTFQQRVLREIDNITVHNHSLSLFPTIYNTFIPTAPIQASQYPVNSRINGTLLQLTFPLGVNFINRVELSYEAYSQHQENSSTTFIMLPESHYSYNSLTQYFLKSKLIGGEWQSHYQTNKQDLMLLIKLNVPHYQFYKNTENNGAIMDETLDSLSSEYGLKFDSYLSYSFLLNKNIQVELITRINTLRKMESYFNNNARNYITFGVKGNVNNILRVNDKSIQQKGIIRFSGEHVITELYNIFEYSNNKKDLNRLIKESPYFYDRSSFSSIAYRVKLGIRNKVNGLRNFRYGISPNIGIAKISLNSNEWKGLIADSKIKGELDLTRILQLSGEVNYYRNVLSRDHFLPRKFINSSYTFLKKAEEVPLEEYIGANISLKRLTYFKLLSFILRLGYKHNFNALTYAIEKDTLVSYRQYLMLPKNDFYGMFFAKFKLFTLPLSLYGDYKFHNSISNSVLNKVRLKTRIHYDNYKIGLELIKGLIKLDYSVSYSTSLYKSNNNIFTRSSSFNHKLSFNFMSSNEKFESRIDGELYRFSSTDTHFLVLSLEADYKFNKLISCGIYAYNILNDKFFEIFSNSVFTEYRFKYRILPRQIGVNFKWNF